VKVLFWVSTNVNTHTQYSSCSSQLVPLNSCVTAAFDEYHFLIRIRPHVLLLMHLVFVLPNKFRNYSVPCLSSCCMWCNTGVMNVMLWFSYRQSPESIANWCWLLRDKCVLKKSYLIDILYFTLHLFISSVYTSCLATSYKHTNDQLCQIPNFAVKGLIMYYSWSLPKAPGFMEYYSSRIDRLIKDSLQVAINHKNNGLDCAHWMNTSVNQPITSWR